MNKCLLPALVVEPVQTLRASLIWLHGLGADGHDFAPIVQELGLPEDLGVRFILPHAPRRAVTINGGFIMPAWYDIAHTDLGRTPDAQGIAESRQAIAQLIEAERLAGIAPERILVAGFSQGGVIAIETLCHHQEALGGAIALSCYLGCMPEAIPAAKRPLPVFMAHGDQDTVVAPNLGQDARRALEDRGYAVDWHSYAMPHSVCWEEIEDIRRWLLARLTER